MLYDSKHIYIGVHAHDVGSRVVATEMRRDADRLLRRRQLPGHHRHVQRLPQRLHVRDDAARREARAADLRRRRRRRPRHDLERQPQLGRRLGQRRADRQTTAGPRRSPFRSTPSASPPNDEQIWGINFDAQHPPQERAVFWSPIPKAYTPDARQHGRRAERPARAQSRAGISSSSRSSRRRPRSAHQPHDRAARTRSTTSASTRATASPAGLNLDVTINTDFAQVEVDEQQVNLTRFGLFFPEKRDFFLENSNLFTMGTGCGVHVDARCRPICSSAAASACRTPARRFRSSAAPASPARPGAHNIAMLDIQTDQRLRPAGRQLPREPLQPRRLPAVARRRALRQQGVDGRQRSLQPHDGRGRKPRAVAQNLQINSFLAKTDTPGLDGRDMAFYGRIAYRDPAVERVAELPGRAGQLQRRSRLRAAHRHPHDQGLLQPDAAAAAKATSS